MDDKKEPLSTERGFSLEPKIKERTFLMSLFRKLVDPALDHCSAIVQYTSRKLRCNCTKLTQLPSG